MLVSSPHEKDPNGSIAVKFYIQHNPRSLQILFIEFYPNVNVN